MVYTHNVYDYLIVNTMTLYEKNDKKGSLILSLFTFIARFEMTVTLIEQNKQ